MADEFYLDKDEFDKLTEVFGGIAENFRGSLDGLCDVLIKYDGAWGGDDIGNSFSENYLGDGNSGGARADLVVFGKEGVNLEAVAKMLSDQGNKLHSVDDETAKRFDRGWYLGG